MADNTLLWYCSDNGGLGGISPGSVGHLRGLKRSLYERPEDFHRLDKAFLQWTQSVERSMAGEDYASGAPADHPKPIHWRQDSRYQSFAEQYGHRPEYRGYLERGRN